MVRGPQIDEGIMAALESEKDVGRRVELIALVESRRAKGAVDTLVKESLHTSPEVRTRAMTALANMAAPKDVPAMVRGMFKAAKGPERDNAERAVVLVCQQIPDAEKRADPVIGSFQTATPAEQAALLPLVGRIGGAAAKKAIKDALGSQQPEVYEAGFRALCNWPDPSFADQMLDLARKADKPEQRIWAATGLHSGSFAAGPAERPAVGKPQAGHAAGNPHRGSRVCAGTGGGRAHGGNFSVRRPLYGRPVNRRAGVPDRGRAGPSQGIAPAQQAGIRGRIAEGAQDQQAERHDRLGQAELAGELIQTS